MNDPMTPSEPELGAARFTKKVDEDWKAQAQRDKQKLAAEAAARDAKVDEGSEQTFLEFITVLLRQIQVDLQSGQLDQARFMIDSLSAVQQRTVGNLSPKEQSFLDANLTELKRAFAMVQSAIPGGGVAAPPPPANDAEPGAPA